MFPLIFAAMKAWISYLLIALFSLQHLPVKEMSKLWVKKAGTAQTSDQDLADDDSPMPPKLVKEKADLDKYYPNPFYFHIREVAVSHGIEIALHEAERLVPHFVPDIFTPPPNIA